MPPLLAVYATRLRERNLVATGADVDDRAAASRLHLARGGLRAEKTSLEVGVDHEVPFLFAHVEERRPRLDTGVVHEDVERAGTLDDLVDHRLDRAGDPDVAVHGERLSAALADRRNRLDGAVRRVVIVDRDTTAGTRKSRGNPASNPTPRAGH